MRGERPADRLSVLRLLYSVGYRHASLHRLTFESGRTVALFSLPHPSGRRAFTAFVTQVDGCLPAIEVEEGFVVEPIRGKVNQ